MPEPRAIRIAIVNDYELVVAGVAAVLAPFSSQIEVVELDARMPVVSEVDIVLYDSFGQVQGDTVDMEDLVEDTGGRVVVFSWNTDVELVARTIDAGASGYVSKAVSAEELVDALQRVHAGEVVTPTPQEPSESTFGRWPGQEHGLSAREAEVLALICQGMSNQDVAEQAFLGINTVKTYVRTLYRKIRVTSRTQAVLWGIEHGFEPDRKRHLG